MFNLLLEVKDADRRAAIRMINSVAAFLIPVSHEKFKGLQAIEDNPSTKTKCEEVNGMVGILIASHGRLADALISSVEFIVGKLERIKRISIRPKDREKEIKGKIRRRIVEVDDGDGAAILTDIPGGTPTNLSGSFLRNRKVDVVRGVNMPMLLTLSSYRKGRSLKGIGGLVKKSGCRSTRLMSEVFGMEKKGGSDEDGRR